MAVAIKVPAVGESVQEAMVYKWHKNDGDMVAVDDVLLELETEKATVEIVAETAGLLKREKQEGQVVRVGETLGQIDESAKGTAPQAAKATPAPAKVETVNTKGVPPPAPKTSVQEVRLSPAVGRIVAENNLDPSAIQGSGRGGRLTKGDVLKAVEKQPTAPAAASFAPPKLVPPPPQTDKSHVTGERATTRQPMTMLRRKVAERLVAAQHTNAILTTFNEINMAAVIALRKQYKDQFKEAHGVGLGFMSFFVKAAVRALKEYPTVNGHIDGTDIVTFNYYDIGVAVSTERGLMVPVIRDCDKLTFAGIEQAVMGYGEKARQGKISMEDLSGGTFTVSNGGIFGSLLSTPIINPPQSAILGMHKIEERPIAVNGQVVIAPMMYVALSYDHRLIDGKEAVSFLVTIKECIEDPTRLLLEV